MMTLHMPVLTTCYKTKFPFIIIFRHLHTDNLQITFPSAPPKRPCKKHMFSSISWIKTIFYPSHYLLDNCSFFLLNYLSYVLICTQIDGQLDQSSPPFKLWMWIRDRLSQTFLPVYTSELLLHITASKTVETSLPQRYLDFEVPLWDWRPIFQ